jgi:hypothetical protein
MDRALGDVLLFPVRGGAPARASVNTLVVTHAATTAVRLMFALLLPAILMMRTEAEVGE